MAIHEPKWYMYVRPVRIISFQVVHALLFQRLDTFYFMFQPIFVHDLAKKPLSNIDVIVVHIKDVLLLLPDTPEGSPAAARLA